MSAYQNFSAADVTAMLALIGELHEMPPLLVPRARHMLTGISRLIGAQVSLYSDLKHYLPGWKWQIDPLLDLGWTDAAARETFMSFFEGEQLSDPLTPLCTRPEGKVVTVLRRQAVEDRAWYRSPNVNELRRGGKLDDCIYSHYRLAENGRAMGLAFHRPWGDIPFGERERAIVDLIHHAQPLYRPHFSPDENGKRLSPRQSDVLGALQEGDSEKQIARRLGLSEHTVHFHVKALYRRFAVSSRGELLSLWVKRG